MGIPGDSRKVCAYWPTTQPIMVAAILILVGSLSGCAEDSGAPNQSGEPAGSPPTLTARIQAAQSTAQTEALCTAISPFYWEIGDTTGALVGGTIGGSTPDAGTALPIASATKMLFGAYLLERTGGTLTAADTTALTLKTGYTSFNPLSCGGSFTVLGCFNTGTNSVYTAANDGLFFYGGGHFQKHAVDLGMGPLDKIALEAEFKNYLGSDVDLSFSTPQLAGGVSISPAGYARFLRKLLNQTLRLGARLGEGAVCTLPSACATAVSSPVPEAWHYAYGHWVEDDPATGDGAFSSPGLFGFYPWIDSTKRYYGILARHDTSASAYWDSVQCGRVIRKAFMAGTVR